MPAAGPEDGVSAFGGDGKLLLQIGFCEEVGLFGFEAVLLRGIREGLAENVLFDEGVEHVVDPGFAVRLRDVSGNLLLHLVKRFDARGLLILHKDEVQAELRPDGADNPALFRGKSRFFEFGHGHAGLNPAHAAALACGLGSVVGIGDLGEGLSGSEFLLNGGHLGLGLLHVLCGGVSGQGHKDMGNEHSVRLAEIGLMGVVPLSGLIGGNALRIHEMGGIHGDILHRDLLRHGEELLVGLVVFAAFLL